MMYRVEVWQINLEPSIGAEIKKTRPVVIVSSDTVGVLPLRVVVPLMEWKERYRGAPWMIRILPAPGNGLAKASAADAFQVRSVSTGRFLNRMGALSQDDLDAVVNAIALVIEL